MSVVREDYVMVGVNLTDKIDWNEVFDDEDRYDRIMEPNEQGCFVADQPMSGDLYVVGVRLGKSDPYNGLEYSEEAMPHLDILSNLVKLYCEEEFDLKDVEPKLISFTRWS